MTLFKKLALPLTLSIAIGAFGQEIETPKYANWQNEKGFGMNTDKAYKKLKKKQSTKVIVAVLDSGVDIEHEDLKDVIWVNKDEIPNNGIDDDNNGYVDDVNGWSFLGNAKGGNVEFDNLEMTRIYRALKPKYDTLILSEIPENEIEDFKLFIEVKEKIDAKRNQFSELLPTYQARLQQADQIVALIKQKYGNDINAKDLKKKTSEDDLEAYLIEVGPAIIDDPEAYKVEIQDGIDYLSSYVNYYVNPDYDPRWIIGDNPADFSQTSYGNNDVKGPDALHGTHVAGIIGAVRNNDIGMNGVADNVAIMSVRTVPDGDERDKDVALAIRYAVDNGAHVINMSFGKGYSPYQKEVYEAIKYAESKDVLLVHAAGNDAQNVDTVPNFPSNHFSFQNTPFTNFLTIGASTQYKGKTSASFSNYGQKYVDIFAPGHEIWATVPDNKYKKLQGTSMAAPMVSGVAALLKSYYPNLTMVEVKDIILSTYTNYKGKEVEMPGNELSKVDFALLSVTGGVVNVPEAIKLAESKISE